MYQLVVEDHFDAAHYLPEYRGKCERMHGHRFKVVVRASATSLGDDGMAYDFAEMKRLLREAMAELDHTISEWSVTPERGLGVCPKLPGARHEG